MDPLASMAFVQLSVHNNTMVDKPLPQHSAFGRLRRLTDRPSDFSPSCIVLCSFHVSMQVCKYAQVVHHSKAMDSCDHMRSQAQK